MRESADAGPFRDKKQTRSDKWLVFAGKSRHRR